MSRGKFPLKQEERETVEEVLSYPILGIPERGISQATCQHFGVRSGLSTADGKTVIAHYFPGYEDGEVTGFKKRDLTKPKEKSFSVVGKIKKESTDLFGQPKCQKGGFKLFIVEGEYDALATWEVLMNGQSKTGQYTPNVVSPSFGAVSSDKQFENQEEFLSSFKERVVVYDNDEAGQEGVAKLAFVFDDILSVTLSRKDPCEVIKKESPGSLYKQVVYNAKPFVPDTVLEEALPEDELFRGWKVVARCTILPKLDAMLRGFRGGEGTVLIADTGVGKSTTFRAMSKDFVDQGVITDNIFLEETPAKTQMSFLCAKYGWDYVEVMENPSLITPEMRKEAREWLNSLRCKWIKRGPNQKTLDMNEIIHRLKWSVVQKIPMVILDHLTWLTYEESSLSAIQTLTKELNSIITGSDTHLLTICHVNRAGKKNKHLLKEEDYPFWDKLDKSSAIGSSSIEQNFANMVVLERRIANEDWEINGRRIRVIKNREAREEGVCDMIVMDSNGHVRGG